MGLVEIDVGHYEVMARFCYGLAWVQWVLLWISMAITAPRNLAPHRSEFLGCGLISWVLWCGSLVDFGLWVVDGVDGEF